MSLPQVSNGAPAHTVTGVSASLSDGMHVNNNNYKPTDCAHFPSIQDLDSGSKPRRAKRTGYVKKRLRLPRLRKVDLATDRSNGSDTASVISSILDGSERLSRLLSIPNELYDVRDSTAKDGAISMPRDTLYLYGRNGLDITPKRHDSKVRLVFHTKPFTDINLLLPDRIYDGNYRPPVKMNKAKYLPSLEKPAKSKDTPRQKCSEQYNHQHYIIGESSGTKFISEKSVTSMKFSQPVFRDISSIPLCDVFRYKESMRRALAHGRPLGKSRETLGEKMLSSSQDAQQELETDGNEGKSVVFPILVNYNEVTSDEIEEEWYFRKMKASTLGRPILRQLEENQSSVLKHRPGEEDERRKFHRRKVGVLRVKGRKSVHEVESGYETEPENVRVPSETSMRELAHLEEDDDVTVTSEKSSVTNLSAGDADAETELDNNNMGTQYNENDYQQDNNTETDINGSGHENDKSPDVEIYEKPSDIKSKDGDIPVPESPTEVIHSPTLEDYQDKTGEGDDKEISNDSNNSRSSSKCGQLRLESVTSSTKDDENLSVWKAMTPSARLSPVCPDDVALSEAGSKTEGQGDVGSVASENKDAEVKHNHDCDKHIEPEDVTKVQGDNDRLKEDEQSTKKGRENSKERHSKNQQRNDTPQRPHSLPNIQQNSSSDDTAAKSKSSGTTSVTPRKVTPNRTNDATLMNGPFVFLPVTLKSIGNINELAKRVTVIDTEQYDKFRNERVYHERENGETSDEDGEDEDGDSAQIHRARAQVVNDESTKTPKREVRTITDSKKILKNTLGDRPRAARARGVDQK
ncbi:myb-like protein X [Ptychodera flava]|uniref:myb-like protein X n=1 Tax=Ptychodera flava TaxID=63121 RepID=UPI00396A5281